MKNAASGPIRFGLITFGAAGAAQPWPAIRRFWQFLDRETAFDSAFTNDHLLPPFSDTGETPADENNLEGFVTVAAGLEATERLRLGCLVLCNTFRHPGLVAKAAATLDVLSGGRFELGLGAGWHAREHRTYGIPFPSLRERQDRLEEGAALLRHLFRAAEPVSFAGRYYTLDQAPLAPKPVQQPFPLLIGGAGERRTLRTLARYGDVANLGAFSGTPAQVAGKVAVIHEHCRAAGRDSSDITISIGIPIGLTTYPESIARAEAFVARYTGTSATSEFPFATRGNLSDYPIGTPKHVRNVLGRYVEAGVTYFILQEQPPWDEEWLRTIDEEIVRPLKEGEWT